MTWLDRMGEKYDAFTRRIVQRLGSKREKIEPVPEGLARRWGRLNPQAVIRYVPKAPVFVHCHECRWPVNPGRTHMLLGNDQHTEATDEQMQRICEGVRSHMGAV